MLAPNQIQDLSVMLNTDPELLERVYESSDVDITDEMAIVDILSGSIELKDYGKIKTILQNYPLFDDILLKMNIVEQVKNIDKLNKVSICENLTKKVLESFQGTPLYNILKEAKGKDFVEKNENIRKRIMEQITPKMFLKPIMEGIEISREKKPMNETIYNDKILGMNEKVIEPIKPIQPVDSIKTTEERPSTLSKEDIEELTDDEATEEMENLIDSDKNIDPLLLKRAFGDINTEELGDLYKDMDQEDLQDHLDAIEEYLK